MIAFLANPDLAILTLLAGILLVYVECNRPGIIFAGCLGTLLILLALNSLRQIPLHTGSVLLVVAASILIPLDAVLKLRNLAATAGGLLLAYGLAHLPEPFAPRHVHLAVAVFAAFVFTTSTVWLARIALLARRNKRVLQTSDRIAAPHKVD